MIDVDLNSYSSEPIRVNMGGHTFTFNELGALNELALQQIYSRINLLSKKQKPTKADEAELQTLIDRTYKMVMNQFDDGQGGEITLKVLGNLTNDQLQNLREHIIAQSKTEAAASGSEAA